MFVIVRKGLAGWWHNQYVTWFYSSCPWCNAPTTMHKLLAYYCADFTFWYRSCQTLTWIWSWIACFWMLPELYHGIIARMHALSHGRSPWVTIGILEFSECLTNIVSIFEGLNDVVLFYSHLIIGCLLGWSEVIIVVIDWLYWSLSWVGHLTLLMICGLPFVYFHGFHGLGLHSWCLEPYVLMTCLVLLVVLGVSFDHRWVIGFSGWYSS
jgi:hypothetical protein